MEDSRMHLKMLIECGEQRYQKNKKKKLATCASTVLLALKSGGSVRVSGSTNDEKIKIKNKHSS